MILPAFIKRLEPAIWGLAAGVLVLFTVFALLLPHYASVMNITQLLRDYAEPALIVTGMALVILAGGIDLSVGAVFAVANLLAIALLKLCGVPLGVALPLTLAAGLLLGLCNGLLIACLRTPPFLTTLCMLLILRAAYEWVADEYAVALVDSDYHSAAWDFLASGTLAGIPLNMLVLLLCALLAHLLLTHSRWGMSLIAVGYDIKVARHAGIRVRRVLLLAYASSSVLAALAGILYAARQNSTGTDTGVGMELMAITACVLGGISLSGGKGSIGRALLGAALIFLLVNGLIRFNISGSLSATVTGIVLLVAIACMRKSSPGINPASKQGSAFPAALPLPAQITSQGSQAQLPSIVSLQNITKQYGGQHALRQVSLELYQGEIMALLGENGAGKSTLCKILAGAVTANHGQILLQQSPQIFRNPADSIKAGIAMIYQESSLIEAMTVAQNILLGQKQHDFSQASANEAVRSLLLQYQLDIDPATKVARLSSAQKKMLETLRAIHLQARVMIFDEPTASLSQPEADYFYSVLRQLRAQGVAIVLVTHALEEVLAIADQVSILRDGRCIVQRQAASSLDRAMIIRHMVGSTLADQESEHSAPAPQAAQQDDQAPGLELRELYLPSLDKAVSLSFPASGITGMAGLVGAGRTEIAKAATATLREQSAVHGQVLLHGEAIDARQPRQAIAHGLVYVTENRHEDGLFSTMNVADNLYLARLSTQQGWRFWYSRQEARRQAEHWISRLAIKGLSAEQAVATYSGGNQQKILIARALLLGPEVVFFDEPTHGVDVGAIANIHQVIQELATQGKVVILISSYLPELLKLSSRILVMRQGSLAGELKQASQESILNLALH